MRKCLCGAKEGDGERFTRDGASLLLCARCGTIVTLSDVDLGIYQRDYHDTHQVRVGHLPYTDRFDHDLALAARRLEHIKPFANRFDLDSLLDVGCSNGAFVIAAGEEGFQAFGFEVNEQIASYARRRGAKVMTHPEGLRALALPGPGYAIITAHDVIEHFADPALELAEWRRLLRVNGLLVIDTPDVDCALAREKGPEYHHIRPDEHLFLLSERLLRALLSRTGFAVSHVARPIPGKMVVYAQASPWWGHT